MTYTGGQAAGSVERIEREAVAQFTVHAEAFARAAVVNDERALDVLAALAAAGPGHRVVDVACGPGIVTCRLAAAGATVTGVDLTPAMLRLAADRADTAGCAASTAFALGRMDRLPFPSGRFDVVVNRYALHHAAEPDRVAAELGRVAAPGGRLVIVDFAATENGEAATAYDEAERRRDPSHVRNLTAGEQQALFTSRGWRLAEVVPYRVTASLDAVLANSHGPDHDGVRARFEASLGGHGLGVDARRQADDIVFDYPLVAQLFQR